MAALDYVKSCLRRLGSSVAPASLDAPEAGDRTSNGRPGLCQVLPEKAPFKRCACFTRCAGGGR